MIQIVDFFSASCPEEVWNIIYSYVGKHPILAVLEQRFNNLDEFRWAFGDRLISNRSLRNLYNFRYCIKVYGYLSTRGVYGDSNIELNIRGYEEPSFTDYLEKLDKYQMKYFQEFDDHCNNNHDEFKYKRLPYKRFTKTLHSKFRKEKIVCNCGSSMGRTHLRKHLVSDKHRKYVSENLDSDEYTLYLTQEQI
jgi:hypothetical protein